MDDLREYPLERFCNFVWWMLTRNMEEQKDVDALRAKLWVPPIAEKGKEIPAVSPWSAENEKRAFDAVKAMTSG